MLRISLHLFNAVEATNRGQVLSSPVDVELAPNVIVQPDVVVVLNEGSEKIQESRIIGTPDLVVEVASPSTRGFDRRLKQDAYARAGVPEYWIVNLQESVVEVYSDLAQGSYQSVRHVGRGETLVLPEGLSGEVAVDDILG